MAQIELQQSVLDLLKNLRGLEPLKKLFWSELNYERVNQPLSRRGWTDMAASALAEDPVLFAGGGENNEFHVIYARLAPDRFSLGQERPVASRLLRDHPYTLFVFSNSAQDRWHFLNVKYDEEITKRRLFRRITIGLEERLRTASERVSLLDLTDLSDQSPLAIQERHDEAFDVEAVTNKFFEQYASIFKRVEQLIQGIVESERKRLFTQRLFNRLMFIAFIQKKGWLRFDSQQDYLSALWKSYEKEKSSRKNFYRDRLKLLFFAGLNTPNEVNIIGINRGGFLKTIIGNVPYLNGGLFEEDEDDRSQEIVVPDECVYSILYELFDQFNFTVTESTPFDVEVAVDPEMLGKVFEELVTGRHETGSYYTHKPVVSFMCREALKGYLRTILPGESPPTIEEFVEEHNPAGLRDPETVLETLRYIKVCDLACGSGAYLLGMLHELLDLRTCLFATRNLDPISTYERKLEIIQNNVYGVDLDPFAVNIARLRLWLSLAVEFEGTTPPPLPNLDFKIEVGDSLTAPNPEGLVQAFRDEFLHQYWDAKAHYMTAHGSQKVTLRQQISKLRDQIAIWAHGGNPVTGFDWQVEFAEIFSKGGFDIVLANPPYVRADAQFKYIEDEDERQAAISKWKDYRSALLKSGIYRSLYEKWDLYLPFLERAYQLLHTGGRMIFIISDAYNAAKYADKSHEFFYKNTSIERIDFCSEIPLFEAGIYNTIVHFSKTAPNANHQPIRVRRWGESKDDFERNIELLATANQLEFGTTLFRVSGAKPQKRTGFAELGKICYVSYGLRANADDRYWQGEFTTDDCLSATQDRTHPKPFVQGKDFVKWHIKNLWYLEWGTNRAPKKFSRPTFSELHEAKEKLVAVRTPGAEPKVIYDDHCLHFDASSVGFVSWHLLKGVSNKSISKTAKYRWQAPDGDREEREQLSLQFNIKYLLAIMNSTFTKGWLAAKRRSKVHVYPDDWKSLPIMPISVEQQMEFVKLVDAILAEFKRHGYSLTSTSAKKVMQLEKEIDERVGKLYGASEGN
jgi:methylase of polypeptide subunit release factors